jgi:hypothetical protein
MEKVFITLETLMKARVVTQRLMPPPAIIVKCDFLGF